MNIENQNQLSPKRPPALESFYWEMLAELDLTKHLGGIRATDELGELCNIDEGKYVLDVGCGVGMTPCYFAEKFGCKVVGIDIYDRMIDRANERAKNRDVEDNVTFKTADIQNLPFEDAQFDVVFGESILPMVEDQQQAVKECVRVTGPGGHVGFNETTWRKTPTSELLAYLSRTYGSKPEILTADGWRGLLEGSGLRDVIAKVHEITVRTEFVDRIKRYGLRHFLGIWYRFFSLYFTRPTYRDFLKEALSQPRQLSEYWGFGVYVGRKRNP